MQRRRLRLSLYDGIKTEASIMLAVGVGLFMVQSRPSAEPGDDAFAAACMRRHPTNPSIMPRQYVRARRYSLLDPMVP